MTTDVEKLYRAVLLTEEQRDLHLFHWRDDCTQPLRDYRMTRLTFGKCASSFAVNMALRAHDLANKAWNIAGKDVAIVSAHSTCTSG